MSEHFGRLFDHVHLRVADLERSKVFYTAASAPSVAAPKSAKGRASSTPTSST